MADSGHEHGDGAFHVHVVPFPVLLGVFVALLVLTGITVGVAQYDFGDMNIVVALAVAAVKGSLVALYFMHMKYERPFNAIVFVISLAFVALLIGVSLMDAFVYQEDLIPGYAPGLEQSQ
mgnify:CR=1 FL=1